MFARYWPQLERRLEKECHAERNTQVCIAHREGILSFEFLNIFKFSPSPSCFQIWTKIPKFYIISIKMYIQKEFPWPYGQKSKFRRRKITKIRTIMKTDYTTKHPFSISHFNSHYTDRGIVPEGEKKNSDLIFFDSLQSSPRQKMFTSFLLAKADCNQYIGTTLLDVHDLHNICWNQQR